ncbi:MAG: element excision factor XisH family protein [Bacteroidota bacterium]
MDFGVEKIIGAKKRKHKIAIELKSFLRPSFAYEFHQTLGQYINY